MINNIITGEKLQQMCDIYIGKHEDFYYNPIIRNQINKHINIDSINKAFDNPQFVFCYSHQIINLSTKIHYFKNKFILITHNSDKNIEDNGYIKIILNCSNLIKWYAQNLLFEDEKLHLLPIGLANSMWPHGNLTPFNDINFVNNLSNKSKYIYFNFNINTNLIKRTACYEDLKNKINWLNNVNPVENLYRLKEYKFCICPEGNGVDTHRLWECLYLKVVPIVIKTPFTKILVKYNIPLVILNTWNDLLNINLNYDDYKFDDITFTNLLNYDKLISEINT